MKMKYYHNPFTDDDIRVIGELYKGGFMLLEVTGKKEVLMARSSGSASVALGFVPDKNCIECDIEICSASDLIKLSEKYNLNVSFIHGIESKFKNNEEED